MQRIRLLILLSRPLFLLGGALVYGLGVGIARYLGTPIDWSLYIIGQAYVTTMQLSAQYLNEYFDAPADQKNPNRTPFSGGSGAVGEGKLSQETVMWAALTTLTSFGFINRGPDQRGAADPLAGYPGCTGVRWQFLLFNSPGPVVPNRLWRAFHLDPGCKPGADLRLRTANR